MGFEDPTEVVVGGEAHRLYNVHDPANCEGHGCWVHHPSNHHMRGWRLVMRGKVERICPHGIGHPDPDDLGFIERTYGRAEADAFGVHGCDGCCVPPTFAQKLRQWVGFTVGTDHSP